MTIQPTDTSYSRLNFRRQVFRYCSESLNSPLLFAEGSFPAFVYCGDSEIPLLFKSRNYLMEISSLFFTKDMSAFSYWTAGSFVSIPRPIQLLLQVGTAYFGWFANFSCKWWTKIYLFWMMTFYEEYITGETELMAIEHMFRRRDGLFRLIHPQWGSRLFRRTYRKGGWLFH